MEKTISKEKEQANPLDKHVDLAYLQLCQISKKNKYKYMYHETDDRKYLITCWRMLNLKIQLRSSIHNT